MSKRFDGNVVWITGGGSGIGRAMARRFAAEGAIVAVSGRRQEKLEETVSEVEEIGASGLAVPCDVTEEAAVRDAVASVVGEFGRLDVAVANAGFGVSGKVEELSADDWRRQFDVNVVGLTSTVREALPHLQETNGRLALVGSVSGFVATPGAGPYQASKYAVRSIGQSLALELHGSGVSCTTIHPGFVESEIAKVDNEGEFREEWEDRRPGALMWPAEKAARVMVSAIYRRKREYVFTWHGRFAAFMGKHFPGLVHFLITRFAG